MSTTQVKLDKQVYGQLLIRALPRPIRNDREFDQMTAKLLELDEREETGQASAEEHEVAELLTALIERYEDEHYPVEPDSSPREHLLALMEHREVLQAELAEAIGSRSLASEILSGKRDISKSAAKVLAKLFHVPADLFI